MKFQTTTAARRRITSRASLLGFYSVTSILVAADTNSPPAEAAGEPMTPEQMFEGGTNTAVNWIDFSAGGIMTRGNRGAAQQRHQTSYGLFGGVSDLHYQTNLDKITILSVDGRALYDNNDYDFRLDVQREKIGFLRLSYSEFRTWSNGDGGYFPPADVWYPIGDRSLALDRSRFIFEGGLRLEKVPEITFKYRHNGRQGEKASTIWGIAHPAISMTRGLSPSFYDIDERSDAFQLDVAHRIKTTDFGLGLVYESGKLDNALKITQSPREPAQQRITDRQGTTYDLFNVHAFTETWIKQNLLLTSGYSYSDLDNTLSGSRIYGSDFDVGYAPGSQNGAGYHRLHGGSRLDEHVWDLNLMYRPVPVFSITPSVRVQKEEMDASVRGFQTLGTFAATPFSGESDRAHLDVRERLDLNYTGVTNYVFHARGEWSQGNGDLRESGGLGPVNAIGISVVRRETEDTWLFQKYTAGVRWYPHRRVVLDVGGYYKLNRYDYDHHGDSTPNDAGSNNRYPAFLVMQEFETFDGNLRLTLRPRQNLTLVSRYEHQLSTIHTQPDSASGLGEAESSEMTSHIIAQDVSWTPWSRIGLQAGLNYVLSDTRNPASAHTRAILNSQNNYWAVNLSSTFVLDEKSDLILGYGYYRADNYEDNSAFSVPYGSGAEEHGVTASVVRRIRHNLQLSLKYGYFRYKDAAFGGNADFQSHLVYSTLRYRF